MGFFSKLFGGGAPAKTDAAAESASKFAEWEEALRREVMERVKIDPRIV